MRSLLKQPVENVLASTAGPSCLGLYILTISLCSDWWFADPFCSCIHDQGKVDAPRKGSKQHCANAATPVSFGPTPPAILGLTAQTTSISSGHEAQASSSMLLQHSKAQQPATGQHKALPAASAAQSNVVEGTISGGEGGAAHAMHESLRTTLPRPKALGKYCREPGMP